MAGVSSYMCHFEEGNPPPLEAFEPPKERRARKKKEKEEIHRRQMKELVKEYDPHSDPNTTRDPYSTLFVGRVSYETTEKKLKREFSTFGTVKGIRMVTDRHGKPRGYAFIEYGSERDMKEAYKHADGRKIDGRRVLVDVERGRTVDKWLPRRLGGGRGPARWVAPKTKALATGGGGGGGLNLSLDRRTGANLSALGPPSNMNHSSSSTSGHYSSSTSSYRHDYPPAGGYSRGDTGHRSSTGPSSSYHSSSSRYNSYRTKRSRSRSRSRGPPQFDSRRSHGYSQR